MTDKKKGKRKPERTRIEFVEKALKRVKPGGTVTMGPRPDLPEKPPKKPLKKKKTA